MRVYSADYAVARCLFVCPSVTRQYRVKFVYTNVMAFWDWYNVKKLRKKTANFPNLICLQNGNNQY